MGLFSRSKRGFITGAAAVTIVAASFGYLIRDCVNFGKVEGDTRPARLAQAEKRIFKEALAKLEKIEVPVNSVNAVKENLELTRNVINSLERERIKAEELVAKRQFEDSLKKLQNILGALEKTEKSLNNAKGDISKLLSVEAFNIMKTMWVELEEDIAFDIGKVKQLIKQKEVEDKEAMARAFEEHKKLGGK